MFHGIVSVLAYCLADTLHRTALPEWSYSDTPTELGVVFHGIVSVLAYCLADTLHRVGSHR